LEKIRTQIFIKILLFGAV